MTTASLLPRLRRMTNLSPTDAVYTDAVLVEYLERYPLIDAAGEPPTVREPSTGEEEVNPDWAPTYDLNRAAADVWEEKASALSSNFDLEGDGAKLNRSQQYEHAIAQARRFRSRRSARVIPLRPEPSYMADHTAESN
jgi:hypothetical protein